MISCYLSFAYFIRRVLILLYETLSRSITSSHVQVNWGFSQRAHLYKFPNMKSNIEFSSLLFSISLIPRCYSTFEDSKKANCKVTDLRDVPLTIHVSTFHVFANWPGIGIGIGIQNKHTFNLINSFSMCQIKFHIIFWGYLYPLYLLYPLPHPQKYVLLWEMIWNKVSHYILRIFDKNTNPLFLRIFSENVPLNVSTVSPTPPHPTHTFHGAASELDFTLRSKQQKSLDL